MWITAEEEEDGDVAADGLSADGLMTKDDVLFDPAVTSLIFLVAMCLWARLDVNCKDPFPPPQTFISIYFCYCHAGQEHSGGRAGPINLCFQRNLTASSVCIQIDTSRGLEQRIALAPPAFRHPSNHYWSVSRDQRYSIRDAPFFMSVYIYIRGRSKYVYVYI